jgi:hypothetical protein
MGLALAYRQNFTSNQAQLRADISPDWAIFLSFFSEFFEGIWGVPVAWGRGLLGGLVNAVGFWVGIASNHCLGRLLWEVQWADLEFSSLEFTFSWLTDPCLLLHLPLPPYSRSKILTFGGFVQGSTAPV